VGVIRPIVVQGALVGYLDQDLPLGSVGASNVALTNAFLSTVGNLSANIVTEIRDDSDALLTLTIPSTANSTEPDIDPYISIDGGTELFARITDTPNDATHLSGWLLLNPAGWAADAADEPVTLIEAKSYLRVDYATDDDLIEILIAAAREAAEDETGKAIVGRVETLFLDKWPGIEPEWFEGARDGPISLGQQGYVDLPYGASQGGLSISTFDDSDNETVFASSNYYFDTASARITLRSGKTWPSATRAADAIKIVWTIGYSEPATVPSKVKAGILNHVAVMYEHRESDVPMPESAKKLYGTTYVAKDLV